MRKSLPLVNLSLLRPVLTALRERGIDPEPVLDVAGLTEDAVTRDDATVHVMVIHEFLEACASAVNDPTFCASVGGRLDPSGWPMIAAALARGGSLADFLSIYVSRANEVASSVMAYLDVRGDHAVYGETRLFRPTIVPEQNDGFMVSLAVSILRRALGERFAAGRVTLIVCNPAVLPADYAAFPQLKGDEMGFRIKFPSEWLVLPVEVEAASRAKGDLQSLGTAQGFLADFRSVIVQHTGQGALSGEQAAALVAMSQSKLARRLAKEGTSISAEIRRAAHDFARDRLLSSNQSVDEIAAALGYANPSNFTRAFRAMEGMSPRAFRRQRPSERSAMRAGED